MTDIGSTMWLTARVEQTKTEDGNCISSNSRGEMEGLYYESPPEGEGWKAVGRAQDENGWPCTIWRRVIWGEPEYGHD
jgi:hypothetical protein